MNIDVAGELRAALDAAGLIGDALDARIEAAVSRALARRETDQLMALSDILRCSKRAALARLARDPDLRALGLRVGRQLRFRRAEVETLLAQRQRERASLPDGGA